MHSNDEQSDWSEYREHELARLVPTLKDLGYSLEGHQPHVGGERYLTRPIASGRKLLLLAHEASGNRVVIKASSEAAGIAELEHERRCRTVLEQIRFSYETFLSPREILFVRRGGLAIAVTEFIEQERSFLERPVEEQFALALKAFKAQEGAHATTYAHARTIRSTFGEMRSTDYVRQLKHYGKELQSLRPDAALHALVARVVAYVEAHQETLEQYCGFLTHWDFVPQNVRVSEGKLYLLDHSSLRFGNKYEGWARFINFMELYNPPLAKVLIRYVGDNRAPEELVSLKLMRVYRLAELIRYYAGWLPRTQGDLHKLARARIAFWSEVSHCVLGDAEIPAATIESYKKTRDALRSEEEKRRQVGLH